MTMLTKRNILMLVALSLVFGCGKMPERTNPFDPRNPNGKKYTITGNVVDELGCTLYQTPYVELSGEVSNRKITIGTGQYNGSYFTTTEVGPDNYRITNVGNVSFYSSPNTNNYMFRVPSGSASMNNTNVSIGDIYLTPNTYFEETFENSYFYSSGWIYYVTGNANATGCYYDTPNISTTQPHPGHSGRLYTGSSSGSSLSIKHSLPGSSSVLITFFVKADNTVYSSTGMSFNIDSGKLIFKMSAGQFYISANGSADMNFGTYYQNAWFRIVMRVSPGSANVNVYDPNSSFRSNIRCAGYASPSAMSFSNMTMEAWTTVAAYYTNFCIYDLKILH